MPSAAKATCHFPVLFSRPALTYPAFRSDLDAVLDRSHDLGHRIIHGDAVALLAAAVAERDRSGGHVVIAGEQHEWDLLALCGPDLLLHPVVARVHLDPDPPLPQAAGDAFQVRHVRIGDREAYHLNRVEPRREGPRGKLDQDARETPGRPRPR